MASFTIRPITPDDNAAAARIIRDVMTEFGAVGDGYSITDPEVDDMYSAYQSSDSAFFVAELEDGGVVAVSGIAPLAGGDAQVCELRKMYALPQARGKGIGKALMGVCLSAAQRMGYDQCYLETLSHMDGARGLYEHHGFQSLDAPMGDTGHHGCNNWYLKTL